MSPRNGLILAHKLEVIAALMKNSLKSVSASVLQYKI